MENKNAVRIKLVGICPLNKNLEFSTDDSVDLSFYVYDNFDDCLVPFPNGMSFIQNKIGDLMVKDRVFDLDVIWSKFIECESYMAAQMIERSLVDKGGLYINETWYSKDEFCY